MRILLAESDSYSPEALACLQELGEVECGRFSGRRDFLAALGEVEVLIVRLRYRVDRQVLDAAPKLRVIVSPTTGLDHIDLAAAEARQVAVLSLKGETSFLESITATAELTWALVLELARHVGDAHRDVMKTRWERDSWVGRGLKGRTLGLLGFGRLGRIVADYGHAFRMPVIAHDPFVDDYPSHVRRVELGELLETADILSIHVSLDAKSTGMIDAEAFARMKTGAWVINTARGQIVDEAALLDALTSGKVAAAGLDVLADEASGRSDWQQENALLAYAQSHDNLILTPHIGGATADAMAETELFMARKLRAHLHSAAGKAGNPELI